MWLGLPLIEATWASLDFQRYDALGDGVIPDSDAQRIRIGLCHHPREWLHREEHDSYSDRPNTFRLVASNCDLLLHGHVHGALEPPTRAHNVAQTFTGGASYASGRYRNNFSLLQVNLDDHSVRRRGFEYDPRTSVWEEIRNAAGTFQLRSRDAPVTPDDTVSSIAGSWRSVFWQEQLPSTSRTYFDSILVPGDQEGQFVTSEDSPVPLKLRGELRDGFFSGYWTDSDVHLHGTFQLKVAPGGDQFAGRWLGFDKEKEIRVGYWRFERVEDSSRPAYVESPGD
jgi:hypothetical protein